LVTSIIAVGPDAQNTEPVGYWEAKEVTEMDNVQLCPPIFITKLAKPLVLGVPEIARVIFPEPFAKFPGESTAVNPFTPVEVNTCPLKFPPSPPEYGITALPLVID
jgi:hypothetical protein